MGSFVKSPTEQHLNIDKVSQTARFLILSLPDNQLSKLSPFAIEKGLHAIGGSPKSVKRLRSGDLLIETASAIQTKSFLLAKKFLDYQLSVTVHKALNSCRGVVSDKELMMASESEIIEGLSTQGVIAARRINIRRGNDIIPTKHVTLTFSSSKLPSNTTAGYIRSPVKPYIPNPLCCFNCQRFGHSKVACRGQLTCSNCGIAGHSANGCQADPHCFHCKQDHSSDSKDCPQWKTEKKIQEIKIKQNITYAEAKKLISQEKTPSYSQAVKSSVSQNTQTDENITKVIVPPLTKLKPGKVIDDYLHNSDHFPLIITDNRHNSANHYYSPKYVYNAADWQKFSSLADITSAIIDNHTVDEALENIISIIKTAADASIPLAKANLIKFKKSKADSRRIQRQSQRLSWRKYISTITSSTSSKELWQKVKKACGNVPSHSISTLTNNDQTISSPKEIADTIASSLVQISSSRNYPDHFLAHKLKEEKTKLNFNTQFDLPYNNSFTLLEFQSCLSTVHNSAPGPDNIGSFLIKHLTIESQTNILRLYNRIWQEQTFPTLWHQAIITPILKPGKDATNPLNYRPIALTCCLCKLLERLVNRRLVHYLETNNIIHPHQSGFRKGRCTLDNLLSLETDIRLAFLQKKHLVAIFFDIEKAYDRTWRHGILSDLYAFGLRGNLPIFIRNFLRLRKFRVRVGFEFSDSYIQEEGVPQGSVLSVSLFIIKINNILHQLPSFVKGHLYVDDLYISCTGNHISFIEQQLQTAVQKIKHWSDFNGFNFSASKSSGVHFCRKRGLHLDPEIEMDGRIIQIENQVRFLGILFDRKLTFLSHVKYLRKRCERALNILKVLSNTSWGADRLSLQRIYRSTILSTLDYGSAIYGSARKSVLKKLDPIHHSALRLCSGAFRTSPTSSLYVDCYEPPLEIRRQMLSLHYYLRISSNTRHPCHGFQLRPFLHRLQQARPSSVPTFFTRMHNLMKDFNLHEVPISLQPSFLPPWKDSEFKYLNPFGSFDKSNTSDTIFQQLFADHRLRFHDFVPIYTDGSKLSSRVSFAVVFPKSVSAFTLLPFCSIFTAEITAVFHALKQILKCPIGKYAIYTDSLSVLQALNSLHCKSHPLVFSVLDLYEKLISQGFSLVFCWVPSHVGIAGNEQADSNARSATHFSHEPVPVCDLKKHIKSCLQMKWQIH
ncbi:putative RNA-directed DNA polymerase from transposon X-element [Araneus ventricosus]|uniref:Putative RNA-directed DNA polymerase from transposon X-element n=1 Tax=Araneus ventricosus TaxID=182803 RepID=A0A4Y2CLD6_ARAVE|nr:putative RNA-directed DNA polymerase from transposon X-element [Araneus ventricosus]